MFFSIRAKIVSIILLSAGLPLLVALAGIHLLGARYYARQKAAHFETISRYLADSLDEGISSQLKSIEIALSFSNIPDSLESLSVAPLLPEAPLDDEIDAVEARWIELPENAPEIRALLDNPAARFLQDFQRRHPLFAEIFLTDRHGRLLAITNKTSDYWQADEEWWQNTIRMAPHEIGVYGVHYDESAGIYSLDGAFTIFDSKAGRDDPVGVLKAVLNITPLLNTLRIRVEQPRPGEMVVTGDGRILANLTNPAYETLSAQVTPEAMQTILRQGSGWDIGPLLPAGNSRADIYGFAPLDLHLPLSEGLVGSRILPMDFTGLYVVVHMDRDAILAPMARIARLIMLVAAALTLGCMALGYLGAQRQIVAPLRSVQAATAWIARRAFLNRDQGTRSRNETENLQKQAVRMAQNLLDIRTRDEVEQLARSFYLMADRVLNVHDQLEMQVAEHNRTAEDDMNLARDFQRSLAEQEYPQVPGPGLADTIQLAFGHVYQPAATVAGDLLDIARISDHEAGMFIGDVMGHGSRAAMTAGILRALLKKHAPRASTPAELLGTLNRVFYDMMPKSETVIFASGLYLRINTKTHTLQYACAGHSSPFLINRTSGKVEPLHAEISEIPALALGLLRDSTYALHQRKLEAGDMILLFTDGLLMAGDRSGEQYGPARFRKIVEANSGRDIQALILAVHEDLKRFMGTQNTNDDICLAGVEIVARQPGYPYV